MHRLMDGLSFPVEFGQLKAEVSFMDLGDSAAHIELAALALGLCSHPGGCSCFHLTEAGHTLMHVTDK